MPDYDRYAQAIGDPSCAKELWEWKMELAVDQFYKRQISDVVFEACLYALGFRGVRCREEYRYHEQIRYDDEQRRKGRKP